MSNKKSKNQKNSNVSVKTNSKKVNEMEVLEIDESVSTENEVHKNEDLNSELLKLLPQDEDPLKNIESIIKQHEELVQPVIENQIVSEEIPTQYEELVQPVIEDQTIPEEIPTQNEISSDALNLDSPKTVKALKLANLTQTINANGASLVPITKNKTTTKTVQPEKNGLRFKPMYIIKIDANNKVQYLSKIDQGPVWSDNINDVMSMAQTGSGAYFEKFKLEYPAEENVTYILNRAWFKC